MSRPRQPHCPVHLVAGGAITGLGRGLGSLVDALRSGRSALQPPANLGMPGPVPALVAALSPSAWDELAAAGPDPADDRAFLLARTAMTEALASVPTILSSVPRHRRALVLSTTKADVVALEQAWRGQVVSAPARRHADAVELAGDLAARFDLAGPVRCVSTACVSGLAALQLAAEWIRDETAELVAVAGVDLVSRFVLSGFHALKSLDPVGCRPFDRARSGLSLGEGAGVILLGRGDALGAGGVRLAGWGASNDANHLTGPSRDGAGLALAMRRALSGAGLEPGAVDYVHAHGTGTPFNDAMEALALRAVFGAAVPPFSGNKGLMGHTLGAAGVLECLVSWLALTHEFIPGTHGLSEPDPAMPGSLVGSVRSGVPLRTVLKVNAGFGGMNAAVVLTRPAPEVPESTCDAVAPQSIAQGAEVSSVARPALETSPWQAASLAGLSVQLAGRGLQLKAWGSIGPRGFGADPGHLTPLSQALAASVAAGHLTEADWTAWFGTDPARFARMDFLSQLSFVATEWLAPALAGLCPAEKERTAVLLETRHGCLRTDLQFLQTPRPSLFPYTLPSTAVGEICIRHRLQGPVLCVLTAAGDGQAILESAARWLHAGDADHCVCVVADGAESAGISLIRERPAEGTTACWGAVAMLLERLMPGCGGSTCSSAHA